MRFTIDESKKVMCDVWQVMSKQSAQIIGREFPLAQRERAEVRENRSNLTFPRCTLCNSRSELVPPSELDIRWVWASLVRQATESLIMNLKSKAKSGLFVGALVLVCLFGTGCEALMEGAMDSAINSPFEESEYNSDVNNYESHGVSEKEAREKADADQFFEQANEDNH
jgi:hypothetical protein